MPQLGITALEYIISKGGNIALKRAKFASGGAKNPTLVMKQIYIQLHAVHKQMYGIFVVREFHRWDQEKKSEFHLSREIMKYRLRNNRLVLGS